MPLKLIRGDITRMEVDAIVNPTDGHFTGLGGTDGAIHRAAGPMLRVVLLAQDYLEVGTCIVTEAFRLPCRYIIHTHGPRWRDGGARDVELLENCYRNSLILARQKECRSIAFPLISGGTYGFPNDDAFRIAKQTIDEFLDENEMEVFLVAYKNHTFHLGEKLFSDVSQYVRENYREPSSSTSAAGTHSEFHYSADYDDISNLKALLANHGETFACMLDRLREERHMKGPELYKKAWVNKTVYSKIINNINYTPAKITAISFGLALELPWKEFTDLVGSAGYAMTHTNNFAVAIEYFVKQQEYDIEKINGVLFDLDPELPLMGC